MTRHSDNQEYIELAGSTVRCGKMVAGDHGLTGQIVSFDEFVCLVDE